MTTLSPQGKDLVLWVLNNSAPLDNSAEGDTCGFFVVKLSLEQIRTLSVLLEDQMTHVEGDIGRCMSDASSYVLDHYHVNLASIVDCLNAAKPLVSEPSTPLAEAPGNCPHPV